MPVTIINPKISDIIAEITAHGGIITTGDFTDIKSQTAFNAFDPNYLKGATDISGVNSLGQYRCYGIFKPVITETSREPTNVIFHPETEPRTGVRIFFDLNITEDSSLLVNFHDSSTGNEDWTVVEETNSVWIKDINVVDWVEYEFYYVQVPCRSQSTIVRFNK